MYLIYKVEKKQQEWDWSYERVRSEHDVQLS